MSLARWKQDKNLTAWKYSDSIHVLLDLSKWQDIAGELDRLEVHVCEGDTRRGSVDDGDLLLGNSNMVCLPHDETSIYIELLKTLFFQHTNGSEVRATLDNWKLGIDITTWLHNLTWKRTTGCTLPSICDALGSMSSTVTGTRQKIVPIQNVSG